LKSLGYKGSFICRNTLLPLSAFDPSVHQRQDGEWFWKKEGYCNNFVFAKSSLFANLKVGERLQLVPISEFRAIAPGPLASIRDAATDDLVAAQALVVAASFSKAGALPIT